MEKDESNVNIDHSIPSQIHEYSKRKLYGEFIPHAEVNCQNVHASNTSAVRCVKCQNLDLCKSLNGYSLQEVYYPDNVDLSGTCAVVESLANQMNNEIFGPTKTFRDIPVCRGEMGFISSSEFILIKMHFVMYVEAVMEYLCLFWGSNNRMYTNCCVFSEPTSEGEIRAPRPPCRSFCVQVSTRRFIFIAFCVYTAVLIIQFSVLNFVDRRFMCKR